jgi:hypothetical protein
MSYVNQMEPDPRDYDVTPRQLDVLREIEGAGGYVTDIGDREAAGECVARAWLERHLDCCFLITLGGCEVVHSRY